MGQTSGAESEEKPASTLHEAASKGNVEVKVTDYGSLLLLFLFSGITTRMLTTCWIVVFAHWHENAGLKFIIFGNFRNSRNYWMMQTRMKRTPRAVQLCISVVALEM
jgi:hypothetical protein